LDYKQRELLAERKSILSQCRYCMG